MAPIMGLNRSQILMAAGAGLALAILAGIVAFALYGYINFQRVFVNTNSPTQNNQADASATPEPTPDPLAPFGVLLMGFGGGTHDGGYLTDTMILAYVQPRQESVSLISLPRDLWVQLPITESETKGFKVNAAYAVGRDDRRYPHKPAQFTGEGGGGSLAKQVVSQITGLPVKYFVTLSFDGFVKSIDVLDGVPVRVPVTFDDYFYPIEANKNELCGISPEELAARTATLSGEKLEQSFPCRYEQLHFDRGLQTLDGETALKYVRSRHSVQAGGDYARSQRQRSLLVGVRDKVFNVGFLPKLVPFVSKLTYDMQMDVDLTQLQEWIGQADQYKNFTIHSIEVSEKTILQNSVSSDRQFILVPKTGEGDWSSIHTYLQDELAKAATESATPSATSTPPPSTLPTSQM